MTLLSDFSQHIKDNKKSITLNIGTIERLKQIGQGQGDIGVVYSGKLGDFTLAFKFLITNDRSNRLQRFIAEYINVMQLPANKYVVKLLDYDVYKYAANEFPVIIMKKYAGSLKDYQRKTKLSVDEFIKLFNFLKNSIKFIHNNGIIHRDLKPENILYENGNFVLADFGIASYNPEQFIISGVTKDERLGNRHFSAPEQEQGGIKPAKTMDIYAMGQILQWYITGDTHKGTERKMISSILKGISIYDSIIDKCITHSPEDRFQTIEEIEKYIEQSKKVPTDPWKYPNIIDGTIRRTFPKIERGVNCIVDPNEINQFITNLQNDFIDPDCQAGELKINFSDIDIYKLERSFLSLFERIFPKINATTTWKLYSDHRCLNSYEYSIKKIWLYVYPSIFKQFIFIETNQLPLFGCEGAYYDTQILVDGKHIISDTELNNGYAIIKGKNGNLRGRMINQITRKKSNLFLTSRYHNIHHEKSEDVLYEFLDNVENTGVTAEKIEQLFQATLYNNNREISDTL